MYFHARGVPESIDCDTFTIVIIEEMGIYLQQSW